MTDVYHKSLRVAHKTRRVYLIKTAPSDRRSLSSPDIMPHDQLNPLDSSFATAGHLAAQYFAFGEAQDPADVHREASSTRWAAYWLGHCCYGRRTRMVDAERAGAIALVKRAKACGSAETRIACAMILFRVNQTSALIFGIKTRAKRAKQRRNSELENAI